MNRQQQKLLRGLVIAAVVLLAVLAAVLLFKRHSAEKQAEEEAAQEAASAITEDHGYTSLTYTNSTATLSFTQDEDGSWIWADDPEFPLDDSTITYIIQILQSLKPQADHHRRRYSGGLRPGPALRHPHRHRRRDRRDPQAHLRQGHH